jgi:hypothetical protein
VDDGAVLAAGDDPADRGEGRLRGLEGVVLVGQADPVEGAAKTLGGVEQGIGGDLEQSDASGLLDDVAQAALEGVAPVDDGVDVVAAVIKAGFVTADPLVAEQGDVEADLYDVGGPGAVKEGVLAPAMLGGVRGGAVFGLDDDGAVFGELEHVEAAADPPGRGLEVEGAGGRGPARGRGRG